jgi:hypothetical protein
VFDGKQVDGLAPLCKQCHDIHHGRIEVTHRRIDVRDIERISGKSFATQEESKFAFEDAAGSKQAFLKLDSWFSAKHLAAPPEIIAMLGVPQSPYASAIARLEREKPEHVIEVVAKGNKIAKIYSMAFVISWMVEIKPRIADLPGLRVNARLTNGAAARFLIDVENRLSRFIDWGTSLLAQAMIQKTAVVPVARPMTISEHIVAALQGLESEQQRHGHQLENHDARLLGIEAVIGLHGPMTSKDACERHEVWRRMGGASLALPQARTLALGKGPALALGVVTRMKSDGVLPVDDEDRPVSAVPGRPFVAGQMIWRGEDLDRYLWAMIDEFRGAWPTLETVASEVESKGLRPAAARVPALRRVG